MFWPVSVGVRAAGAVPRRNIEIAVVAESKIAAVVAVGGPVDDDELRFRVDPVWRPAVDRVAHDLGLLAAADRAVHPNIDIAVALVVGVKGHADGEAVNLEKRLDLARVLVVVDGEQAARASPEIEVLEDEEAVGSRLGGQAQGLLDCQLRKGPRDLVREGRIGRADHARVVPGKAPFEAERLIGGWAGDGDQKEERGKYEQARHFRSLSASRVRLVRKRTDPGQVAVRWAMAWGREGN